MKFKKECFHFKKRENRKKKNDNLIWQHTKHQIKHNRQEKGACGQI